MSKNLEAKLSLLMEDTARFSKQDQRLALLQFIKEEMNLMEKTYQWTEADLNTIKARAAQILTTTNSDQTISGKSLHANDSQLRIYAIAQATYEHMRSQNLTPYVIGIKP
jgi:hypothetical protein